MNTRPLSYSVLLSFSKSPLSARFPVFNRGVLSVEPVPQSRTSGGLVICPGKRVQPQNVISHPIRQTEEDRLTLRPDDSTTILLNGLGAPQTE